MELLIIWIVGSVIVGILAQRFNRNVAGYVVLSLFISPIIVGILLLALGRLGGPRYSYLPPEIAKLATPPCEEAKERGIDWKTIDWNTSKTDWSKMKR
jgi:hypothetical protein